MTSDDQHSVEGWRCEHRSTASPAQRQLVLKLPDAGGSVRTEGLQLVFVCHRHATVGMRIPSISKLRWGGSLLFAPKGSFRWSTAFSMGPLPVTQAWVQKPRFASIAVLAFLTCMRHLYSSAMAVELHHLRCAPVWHCRPGVPDLRATPLQLSNGSAAASSQVCTLSASQWQNCSLPCSELCCQH